MSNRFEVDLKGMRELQGARELWRLVKEIPVNVFDEFNREDVKIKPTFCHVTIEPVEGHRQIEVAAEDDGQGFQNLEDAYTLFRSTPKRQQPEVAGRFNLGEKELMAQAITGAITTTSGTVEFPPDGSRKVNRWRKRETGTRVWAVLPMTKEGLETCIVMLRRLMPPQGLEYTVNGEQVTASASICKTSAYLSTVIQEAPGQPMRQTSRRTAVHIYNGQPEAWLYELGCPIQPIECSYSVDIRQKVPMPPERDTVASYYLQDVFACVAEAMVTKLSEDQVSESWIKQALEDSATTLETAKEIIKRRHGDKAVLWSTNQEANEKAMEAGFTVIPKTALSPAERSLYTKAGVFHSGDLFGRETAPADIVEPTKEMQRIARFAKALAEVLLGIDIAVIFYCQKYNPDAAQYGNGALSFNVERLGKNWFRNIRPEVTGVILHELAHHGSNGQHLPHGPEYVQRLDYLAGKLFHAMLRYSIFQPIHECLNWGMDVIGIEKEK